jgi:hypothetical protein
LSLSAVAPAVQRSVGVRFRIGADFNFSRSLVSASRIWRWVLCSRMVFLPDPGFGDPALGSSPVRLGLSKRRKRKAHVISGLRTLCTLLFAKISPMFFVIKQLRTLEKLPGECQARRLCLSVIANHETLNPLESAFAQDSQAKSFQIRSHAKTTGGCP